MRHAKMPTRRTGLLFGAALAVCIAGCGGGWYFGTELGTGNGTNDPAVSLVVSPQTANAGEIVHLSAAAADDSRVVDVVFFSVIGSTTQEIGTDSSAPFELDFTIPPGTQSQIGFFARARDDDDNTADTPQIAVTIP